MAVKKLEVGKSYKWSDEDPDSDYFVVTNVGEDTFNYTYPTWNNGEGYSTVSYYNNDTLEDFVPFEPTSEDNQLSPEDDAVNHPSHYTSDPSGVECIQITRHRNFNVGNAIKYLWRAGLKKSEGRSEQEKQIEDLKKAVFYIQDEIRRLES